MFNNVRLCSFTDQNISNTVGPVVASSALISSAGALNANLVACTNAFNVSPARLDRYYAIEGTCFSFLYALAKIVDYTRSISCLL